MVRVKRKSNRVGRRSRSLQQPNTWIVLSVALLVVVLTAITSLGPSSLTGNTVQNIGYMNKGDPLHLNVRDVPALVTVFTNAGETIKYGKITVEVDESVLFDRPYVSKFAVRSENKFGPLRFTFKIKEQDLLGQGISRNDLRLYHQGKEYQLQLLKVDHGYLYYVVTVPSMGSFVLGRVAVAEKATVEEKVEEEKETPVVGEQAPEEAAEELPEEPKEEPLVGKAAELPVEEKLSLWSRLVQFFKNLFS